MARICDITGKKNQFGNKVSHANNKSRRRWQPNLQATAMPSALLNRMVRLRLTPNGLRTVEHRGGLDSFLLEAKAAELTPATRKLKKQVEAAKARTAA